MTDPFDRTRGDARHWADARTLADLGALTALWLEREITNQPAWEGPPDAETDGLVGILARANRDGFVTHFSQPGVPLAPHGVLQRAVVSGFCDEDLLHRLQQATLQTDVVLLAYPPGGRLDGLQIPVSVSEGRAWRWAGAALGVETILEYYNGACHPDAVTALRDSWQATLFDPHWGRNDLLWERLLTAVAAPPGSVPPTVIA